MDYREVWQTFIKIEASDISEEEKDRIFAEILDEYWADDSNDIEIKLKEAEIMLNEKVSKLIDLLKQESKRRKRKNGL